MRHEVERNGVRSIHGGRGFLEQRSFIRGGAKTMANRSRRIVDRDFRQRRQPSERCIQSLEGRDQFKRGHQRASGRTYFLR